MKAQKRKLQKPRRISESPRRNSDRQQSASIRQGPTHSSRLRQNSKSKTAMSSQYKRHTPDLSPSSVTVAEARGMVPPGASIWQDGSYGSWQVHLPPYPRRSRSWRKHGEAHSLQLVSHSLWKLYLVEQGWGPELCPVQGVFAEGEVLEETDDEAVS